MRLGISGKNTQKGIDKRSQMNMQCLKREVLSYECSAATIVNA